MRDMALFNPRIVAAVPAPAIRVMSAEAIENVRRLSEQHLALPQVAIETEHVIHAGLYARTIAIPEGVVLTGALIKIATLLIVRGDALVYVGDDEPLHLCGYTVLPASAGRKQAFVTNALTYLTMIFPTSARTVAEAEAQFTDEAALLFSRSGANRVTVTGE